ncbi:MAG: hypothetical protein PHU04_03250 [Candidatus Peribacteraceae bacterium]|nr:hypothetical protein [Candidatus Peribacteraceae bacterium]
MAEPEITLKVLLVHMQHMEQRLTSRINELDVRLSKRIDGVESLFSVLQNRIDRLDTKFSTQIGNIDERLDGIEITLVEGRYDHRLKRLENRAGFSSSVK